MHKRPNKRVNRRKREKRFLMKLAPGASIPFFTPRRFVFAVFISLFPLLYPTPYRYSITLLAAKTSAIKISVFPDIRENECMKKKRKTDKEQRHQFRLYYRTAVRRRGLKISKLIDLDRLPSAVLSQVGVATGQRDTNQTRERHSYKRCSVFLKTKFGCARPTKQTHSQRTSNSNFFLTNNKSKQLTIIVSRSCTGIWAHTKTVFFLYTIYLIHSNRNNTLRKNWRMRYLYIYA